MLITNGGVLVRTRVDEISVVGRNTQGVTVIRLGKKEKVVGVDRIEGLPEEDENNGDVNQDNDANQDNDVKQVVDVNQDNEDSTGD